MRRGKEEGSGVGLATRTLLESEPFGKCISDNVITHSLFKCVRSYAGAQRDERFRQFLINIKEGYNEREAAGT